MGHDMRHADEILQALLESSVGMTNWQLYNLEKLLQKLLNFPPSGGGGAHPALLGAANHAVRIGVPGGDYAVLMRHVIHGRREVTDAEIGGAYCRALTDYGDGSREGTPGGSSSHRPFRTVLVNDEQRQELLAERDRLISYGKGVSAEDIMAASPVVPHADPVQQLRQVLDLFGVNEYVYMGEALGWKVQRASHWRGFSRIARKVVQPHIVPNPFTGAPAPKKGGDGTSFRGDLAVARFRHAVAEFDNLPLDDQLAYWSQVDLPIVALIHSGGKSIHAWIRVDDVNSIEDWEQRVGVELYQRYLIPMGVDSACRNPSRLSRTPGHYRADKGQIQQLLYLAPAGRAVSL